MRMARAVLEHVLVEVLRHHLVCSFLLQLVHLYLILCDLGRVAVVQTLLTSLYYDWRVAIGLRVRCLVHRFFVQQLILPEFRGATVAILVKGGTLLFLRNDVGIFDLSVRSAEFLTGSAVTVFVVKQ